MKTISEAFREEQQYIEKRRSGEIKSMRTPWPTLNKVTMDGAEWGTINTIGAMSGVGKTACINQLIIQADEINNDQNIAVLFFTMEMAARKLIGRTLSYEMKKTVKQLYTRATEEDMDTIADIRDRYIKKDIVYEEIPRTPAQTRGQIESFINSRPGKSVIVAYDHSLLAKREPSFTERETLIQLLGEFNELKKIYPSSLYFLLSQLNRYIEEPHRKIDRTMHFPQKSDIFGSEACWQFSDIVMILHDPYKLHINSYGVGQWPTRGLIYGHILKARDGNPNKVMVLKNNLKHNILEECTQAEMKNLGFKIDQHVNK